MGPAALGERHAGAAQDGEGGRVATALGRPMTPEPQHVRPRSEAQAAQLGAAAQLPGGADEVGHMGGELVGVAQVVGGGAPVQAAAEALGGLGRVLGDVAGHLLGRQLSRLLVAGDVAHIELIAPAGIALRPPIDGQPGQRQSVAASRRMTAWKWIAPRRWNSATFAYDTRISRRSSPSWRPTSRP